MSSSPSSISLIDDPSVQWPIPIGTPYMERLVDLICTALQSITPRQPLTQVERLAVRIKIERDRSTRWRDKETIAAICQVPLHHGIQAKLKQAFQHRRRRRGSSSSSASTDSSSAAPEPQPSPTAPASHETAPIAIELLDDPFKVFDVAVSQDRIPLQTALSLPLHTAYDFDNLFGATIPSSSTDLTQPSYSTIHQSLPIHSSLGPSTTDTSNSSITGLDSFWTAVFEQPMQDPNEQPADHLVDHGSSTIDEQAFTRSGRGSDAVASNSQLQDLLSSWNAHQQSTSLSDDHTMRSIHHNTPHSPSALRTSLQIAAVHPADIMTPPVQVAPRLDPPPIPTSSFERGTGAIDATPGAWEPGHRTDEEEDEPPKKRGRPVGWRKDRGGEDPRDIKRKTARDYRTHIQASTEPLASLILAFARARSTLQLDASVPAQAELLSQIDECRAYYATREFFHNPKCPLNATVGWPKGVTKEASPDVRSMSTVRGLEKVYKSLCDGCGGPLERSKPPHSDEALSTPEGSSL
ncbi:hypothetical protein BD324DRAFT_288665 [Kockovaella imperatae]|uniref:Uncharacterized protein n=1 Tax=Kockovaella imperatae TaxID=4999 RepID=A0A1Y1U5I7_9TREE|nr:hypothetical protein BD324DRAFT_288665 [Kockovaella imperatae]ORX33288.1 hypothetical protein BD324DRAFT_288665 [Kockovaella imperatae]